jgi:hypothetical protein
VFFKVALLEILFWCLKRIFGVQLGMGNMGNTVPGRAKLGSGLILEPERWVGLGSGLQGKQFKPSLGRACLAGPSFRMFGPN